MLRRPVVSLTVILVASLALIACAGGEEPPPTPTATPARFVNPVPFVPTPTPGAAPAPVADALAPDDAIQVDSTALQVLPPSDCELVENLAEPNRLGSARAFDYKLGFGFGCPSADGNLRFQEVQLQTAASLAAYDSQCAAGGCESSRITASDFDAHRSALQSGQASGDWGLLDVGGRSVLARSVPVDGGAAVMRQYAEFCGDVRVENWVVMLGSDAAAQTANADSYFGTLSFTCLGA